MTTTSRLNFTVTSQAIATWTLTFLLCMWCTSAFAADAPTESVTPVAAAYTVSQSTPIDKLVQKVYANSPLNAQVLRQSLVDANPKVISGNPQQRVKAGTVITVPDHAQVVRNVLTPLAAASDTPEPGLVARDFQVRRQWVRFP